MASDQDETPKETTAFIPPLGPDGPFAHYQPTRIEPCAIDQQHRSQPFHLLTCGHIVAVDAEPMDNRCGLNCLHVQTWMTMATIHKKAEDVDLRPGITLRSGLTTSALHEPILPPLTQNQARDYLYCETCQGLPIRSYFMSHPNHPFRRSLGITRPVIEYFAGVAQEGIACTLAKLFMNPLGYDYDPKLTHNLRCGHHVYVDPCRPCAANCCDALPCHSRNEQYNCKMGDAIICNECVYRAELVYERYIQAQDTIASYVSAPQPGVPDVPQITFQPYVPGEDPYFSSYEDEDFS